MFFCFITHLSLSAQTRNAYLDAAEYAFEEEDYYSSMVYYGNALEFDQGDMEVKYMYGESARRFDAYNLADSVFTEILDVDNSGSFPLASFYLAEMKQRKGDYTAAIEYYNLYLSEHGGDKEYYTEKATVEIQACEWAEIVDKNKSNKIKVERLGEDVNTQYSEFAAVDLEDTLIFSSLRYTERSGRNDPNRLISKILKNNNGSTELLHETIDKRFEHVAHSAFSDDKKLMFYTVCEYSTVYNIRCDLYAVANTGTYRNPKKLPDHINIDTVTQTQPYVSGDTLFFVSDRIGSKGGLDIWYTRFDKNWNFSNPVNISAVNSTADDITPYFDKASSKLYFSSNGFRGFGGFDIFSAHYDGTKYAKPDNIGTPYNSSFNDVYYYIRPDDKGVYFSSNREGAAFLDNDSEACCYDIYKAAKAQPEVILNALTFDEETKLDLIGASVKVIDVSTEKLIGYKINSFKNDHFFTIEKDKEYLVIGEKAGYTSDTINLSTVGVDQDTIIRKLYLLNNTKMDLEVLVFDEATLKALQGASVVVQNTSDPTDIQTLENFRGNNFLFNVKRNSEYRITVTKDGYESASVILNTAGENGRISKKIYLKKQENLNLFLPLTLYFDNDAPDPKSVRPKTDKSYTQTYYPYINRKDEFKNEYTKPLQGEQKIIAEQELENFFVGDVTGGYQQLGRFLDALYGRLSGGETITIVIKGYASPKAKSSYNKILSTRRILSIKNELKRYKSGLLTTFINQGALGVREIPYGEELAPVNVSDSQKDLRKSVFSPEASRERKTEILKVETGR